MKTDLKEELIKMLRKWPSIQSCCKKLGIARATYYRWVENDQEFAKQALEALRDGVFEYNGIAEETILDLIQKGNMSAIIFWLRKRHLEYMPINRIEKKDRDGERVPNDNSDSE